MDTSSLTYLSPRKMALALRAMSTSEIATHLRSIIAHHLDLAHVGHSIATIRIPAHAQTVTRKMQRVLRARTAAQAVVSGLAASANGIAYHSTQGWWITPMATDRGTVGLVNTTSGVAIDTGVHLPAATIREVILPAGPLASGNMAAESHRAGYPRGWRQIACDSRGGKAVPCSEIMPHARVAATGLMTCYGCASERTSYEMACGWPRDYQSPFCCDFLPQAEAAK